MANGFNSHSMLLINDPEQVPEREIQDDDQVFVYGGAGGPASVPASSLGGGSGGMSVFFPGPLVGRSSPVWRAAVDQDLNRLAAWIPFASTAACTFEIRNSQSDLIATVTIPAGETAAYTDLIYPYKATFDDPLTLTFSIAPGNTSRDAMAIFTKT
jgi:hypothetical protein